MSGSVGSGAKVLSESSERYARISRDLLCDASPSMPSELHSAAATSPIDRRSFLNRAVVSGLGCLVLGSLGCNGEVFDPAAEVVLDTRTETGVLNTLYAMKQLTGDFFTRVTRFRYAGMTKAELASFEEILSDDSEHAVWFVENVRSGRIYDFLEFDFSDVDLSSRVSVLNVAQELKEASAAAFVGAASTIGTADWSESIAEMGQTEAGHAATMNGWMDGGANGDPEPPPTPVPPAEAIQSVERYFRTRLVIRS